MQCLTAVCIAAVLRRSLAARVDLAGHSLASSPLASADVLPQDERVPFTDLKSAQVLVRGPVVGDANSKYLPQVLLRYGRDGGLQQLLKNSTDESAETITAFADVEWRSPGGELSAEGEDVIQRYVGQYAYSFDVNHRLMRGLTPLVSSDREWQALRNIQWMSLGVSFPAMAMGGTIDWAEYAKEVLDYTVDLAAALNKLPDVEATVWRGSLEQPESIAKWQHAQELRLPGFVSTTTNGDHAKDFLGSKVGFVKSGQPVVFKIYGKHLKDLRRWNKDEEELILLPFTRFRVKEVEEMDKLTQITLEEQEDQRVLQAEASKKHVATVAIVPHLPKLECSVRCSLNMELDFEACTCKAITD